MRNKKKILNKYQYYFFFYCIVVGHAIIRGGGGGITLNGLTPTHFCVCEGWHFTHMWKTLS
jgi:hypothetical protein